jgi:hypothetical protein
MLLAVASASAYTVVMRDGRRLEIPPRFLVTSTTLTYEVQPGIQVTLQLATINVEATEKANNETSGSFLRRVQMNQGVVVSPSVPTRSRKTITNRDLEASARRRVASEQAYERRLKELGLPSLAESRKQAEAATVEAQSEIHERLEVERQTEDYWQARAAALRTEMSALDAEIGFVRAKLDELPYPGWSGSYTTLSSDLPFASFGNAGVGRNFPGYHRQPPVYSARAGGQQVFGRSGVGGPTRGQVFGNRHPWNRGFGSQDGIGFRIGGSLPWGTGIGIPVLGSSPGYDYSYDRSALITRFNELAASKAGLNARFRELEDEARRAGVPPGWLR